MGSTARSALVVAAMLAGCVTTMGVVKKEETPLSWLVAGTAGDLVAVGVIAKEGASAARPRTNFARTGGKNTPIDWSLRAVCRQRQYDSAFELGHGHNQFGGRAGSIHRQELSAGGQRRLFRGHADTDTDANSDSDSNSDAHANADAYTDTDRGLPIQFVNLHGAGERHGDQRHRLAHGPDDQHGQRRRGQRGRDR